MPWRSACPTPSGTATAPRRRGFQGPRIKVRDLCPRRPRQPCVAEYDEPAWSGRAPPASARGDGGGLNAGLLVGRDHVITRSQGAAVPPSGVEIQDRTGQIREPGIAREEPAAMAPGSDRIRVQPPPQRRAADRGDDPARQDFAAQVRQRPPREGDAGVHRALAGDPLDLNDDVGGKSGLGARLAALHRGPQGVGHRIGGATC